MTHLSRHCLLAAFFNVNLQMKICYPVSKLFFLFSCKFALMDIYLRNSLLFVKSENSLWISKSVPPSICQVTLKPGIVSRPEKNWKPFEEVIFWLQLELKELQSLSVFPSMKVCLKPSIFILWGPRSFWAFLAYFVYFILFLQARNKLSVSVKNAHLLDGLWFSYLSSQYLL